MSVWLTIPSKRPPEEAEKTLKLWRERGYKIALLVDGDDPSPLMTIGDFRASHSHYPGYAQSVNLLIGHVLSFDPSAEWFIAAGDDVEPDPNHSAEEIAMQCKAWCHTNACSRGVPLSEGCEQVDTFGVMQPTGDRWGDSEWSRQRFGVDRGAYSDRVCGSAWIGREFARRVNQGKGPLWPEYFHMFVDEELFHVATKLGVLWQRRDLTHLHRHWGRGPEGNENQMQHAEQKMPEFLKRANSAEEWDKAQKLFRSRLANGFPGSEVIA